MSRWEYGSLILGTDSLILETDSLILGIWRADLWWIDLRVMLGVWLVDIGNRLIDIGNRLVDIGNMAR